MLSLTNPTVSILWPKRSWKGIYSVLSKSRDLRMMTPSETFKLVLIDALHDPDVEIAINKVTIFFQFTLLYHNDTMVSFKLVRT